MQSFNYVNATTLEQAVAVLYREGEWAKPLAGGTDIIVQLREGRKQAKVVVDVKSIPCLSDLRYSPESGLVIGAATPMHRIYGAKEIAQAYPGLMDAFSLVGGVAIQGRASLGGNLCTASPAGDTIPALIVHGALCVVTGPDGWREVPVAQFCAAPGKNALKRGELLVEIKVPSISGSGSGDGKLGAAYLRFTPRNEMDIAVASAGVSVRVKGGQIVHAVVALGAVGPTPIVCDAAANALIGANVDDARAHMAAAEAAAAAARPITDMRGTLVQRKHLAGVLTQRALAIALERAH